MKKLISTVLALTLTLSLGATALAAEGKTYANPITINGTAVDVSKIPANPAGVFRVPLRAIAEADYGSAEWFQEENLCFFALGNHRVEVTPDGAITINGEPWNSELKAAFDQGVTFVPVGVLNQLEGWSVSISGEGEVRITTPNGAPLTKLTRQILAETECGARMQATQEELEAYQGLPEGCFEELVAFMPLSISPDTLMIGKVAPGKMDQVKEWFETYRQSQEDTFSWYLAQHLPKVQNAQVVTEGDYVMFVIAEQADTAAELFHAGVKDL